MKPGGFSSRPSQVKSQQNRGNIFCINTLLSQVEKHPALIKFSLRYYAIFKVKKFESLICKINTCLQKTATAVPFLCYFQKLLLLMIKKFWNNFCCIVLLFVWARKVCLRFLKSCYKLEILIFFLSFVVSFLVDMFN